MPWYCTLYLKEDTAVDVSCYYSKECTDDYRRWICKRHSENDNYDSSSYLFSTTNYSVKNEILPELFKKYISMSNSNYNNIIVSFICNLREITSLLVQYVHSGNSSYFFISNPEFSEALAKNTNLESAVCLCYSFGNKNSSSVLISYLEINGVVVEHAPSDKYTGIYNTIEPFDNYNWDVAYGRSTSIVDNKQHLLIYGIQSSLFHSINQTATNLGKRNLLRRITEPPDHSWIQTSLNFIQKFRNNPIIQKVSELLKKINAFDIKATERINDIELGTSFLMDQSTNDSKSIYSRNNLEESSILKYKKIVKNVENIKNNMEIFNVLKKEIEKTNTEEGIFGDLIEALSETSTIERIDTQLSVINCKAECVYPFLADRIGFVVKSGVDSYLDLCRGMYEEKLLMCQDVLNEIQSVYDLEIYFGDDREICLMKTNSHERNEAKMKRNATVEHKSSYRSSSTMLDKVGTFQNRPSKKKRRINSSKAIKLFVLKESKTMILYSCPELKALNKLIRELLDQIIEIEGRICKSILLKIQQYGIFFTRICSLISELDTLISNSMFSKEIQFKRPRIENKVSIHNVSHVLFPEFQRSSYLFENNEVYVITGANMAGKSCYLRNLFHIAILSKIGCFIDCDSAEVPAFDEMYFINSIEDVNILTQKILKRRLA